MTLLLLEEPEEPGKVLQSQVLSLLMLVVAEEVLEILIVEPLKLEEQEEQEEEGLEPLQVIPVMERMDLEAVAVVVEPMVLVVKAAPVL